MSSVRYLDLFFQKKYLDWSELRYKIGDLEEEYKNNDERLICG